MNSIKLQKARLFTFALFTFAYYHKQTENNWGNQKAYLKFADTKMPQALRLLQTDNS